MFLPVCGVGCAAISVHIYEVKVKKIIIKNINTEVKYLLVRKVTSKVKGTDGSLIRGTEKLV